jgi:pyruvate dehydrogenase phosphatase
MEEPSAVLGALLGDQIGPGVEFILGHGAESRWRGCAGNRAVEVLGNLLGGTNIERLSMAMDPTMLSNDDLAEFYIDDTSLIVCDIFKGSFSENRKLL